jgi:predicted transcriptional regulator
MRLGKYNTGKTGDKMKISEIIKILDAEILCGEDMETEVHSACASDMMSDVLAFVKDQGVLITGLVNPQVVRTAEMMDMKCIIFARNKRPDPDTLALADKKGMIVLTTKNRLYIACGLLYTAGLEGGERHV